MVGDEGAVHASDFELEGVLDEPTADQVVILSFETLELALFLVDGVVHIL